MSESARCVADRQISDLFSIYGKMEADFTDVFDEKFRI